MQNVISVHNKAILEKQSQTNITDASTECNCRQNVSCPLSGKCLTQSVVHQATVTREDTAEENTYVGHTGANSKRAIITIVILLGTLSVSIAPQSANTFGFKVIKRTIFNKVENHQKMHKLFKQI